MKNPRKRKGASNGGQRRPDYLEVHRTQKVYTLSQEIYVALTSRLRRHAQISPRRRHLIPHITLEDALKWRAVRFDHDLADLYTACDNHPSDGLSDVRRGWLLAGREERYDEARALITGRTDGLALALLAAIGIARANEMSEGEGKEAAYAEVTELPEYGDDGLSPQGTEGQAELDSLRGMAFAEIGDYGMADRLLHSANRGFRMLGITNVCNDVAIDKLDPDPAVRVEKLKARMQAAKDDGNYGQVPYLADDLVRLGSERLDYSLIADAMQDMQQGKRRDATRTAMTLICSGHRDTPLAPLHDGPPGLMTAAYVLQKLERGLAEQACFHDAQAEAIARELINYSPNLSAANVGPTQVITLVQAKAAIMIGDLGAAEDTLLTIMSHMSGKIFFYEKCLQAEICLRRGGRVDPQEFALLVQEMDDKKLLRTAAAFTARLMPEMAVMLADLHPMLRKSATRVTGVPNYPQMIHQRVHKASEDLEGHRRFVMEHPERSFAQEWLLSS